MNGRTRFGRALMVVLGILCAVVLAGCASTLTGQPVGVGAGRGSAAGTAVPSGAASPSGAVSPSGAASPSSPSSAASAPLIGPADAKVQVSVFEDLGCPPCARFDPGLQIVIDKELVTNAVSFTIYDVSFLDSQFGSNRYSSRAANAALCAAQLSVDDFRHYQSALLREQPPEGGNGRTDAELVATARTVSITSPAFVTCVGEERYAATVKANMAAATSRGVSGVPAVYVNDRKIDPVDTDSLSNAIAAAR